MNYIKLTPENIDKEHICCAIAGEKDPQVISKKKWLRERMEEGLVFLKGNLRGKCFIEYIPAEYAWVPIEADGYLHINCFWVSGSCKGKGYSTDLLDACIADAKEQGKSGITVISSPKKKPFLSDSKYLEYKGFQVADSAEPFYTLMYFPLKKEAVVPKFMNQVKKPQIDKAGFVLYYTADCPYTAKYVPLIEETARAQGIPFQSVSIDSLEKAKKAPAAWTNYALFYNGEYLTNEILSEKKFISIYESVEEKREI